MKNRDIIHGYVYDAIKRSVGSIGYMISIFFFLKMLNWRDVCDKNRQTEHSYECINAVPNDPI